MEPYIVTVEKESQKVLRIVSGYDPDFIITNDDGEVVDAPQIQYFTKYGFVTNPDGGILDLGLGKLLGPTNHAVNTLINQLIDAGTKANMGGGFLGKGLRVKGGKLKFTMGEYKRVDTAGQDLQRNIVTLPTTQPSAVLFQLLGMLINAGQRLSSTLDSQVGENPGQNQKATTSAIVQEAGQKIFNGIYKRNLRSLKKEFKKLFYLNSLYLDDESYLNVLDGQFPKDMERTIRRMDYDIGSVNITPAADSSYQSQMQKMAKAQALFQKIPTGMVNPQVAMKSVLEAEEQPNIEQIMSLPPPQPSPDMIKQQDESKLAWAKFELDVIMAQQNDIKTQTQAILALAQAEGVEAGHQLTEYKMQLDSLVSRSKELGEKAVNVGAAGQRGDQGMDEPEGNDVREGVA